MTERIGAAQRLSAVEDGTLIEDLDVALLKCSLDEQFIVSYGNNKFFELLGYTREQLAQEKGNSIGLLIEPSYRQTMLVDLRQQLMQSGKTDNINCLVRRDGSTIWVRALGKHVLNAAGNEEFHGLFLDISKEQETQALLLERNNQLLLNEKRYEIAMRHCNAVIFDYLIPERRIIHTSGAMARFGWPSGQESSADSFLNSGIVHQHSAQVLRDAIAQMEKGIPAVEMKIVMFDAHGKEVLQEISLTCLQDEQGQPCRAIGVIKDITELNKLQKDSRYHESLLLEQCLTYEANVTRNTILMYSSVWAEIYRIPLGDTFSSMIHYIADNIVHPDDYERFIEFSSPANIQRAWQEGEQQLVMQFMKKNQQGSYYWAQKTMNILQDEITGDLKVRCYIQDVSQVRSKGNRLENEQLFYDALQANSERVYSVNLTADLVVQGHEDLPGLVDVDRASYSQMVQGLAGEVIFAEDISLFLETFDRDKVLADYAKGQTEQYCEYRRFSGHAEYLWVGSTIQVFEDADTQEIKALVYVQDINDEKNKRLELIYKAEHDGLTGLYNKSVSESLMKSFLESEEGRQGTHALFIFDVDHFKQLNDNFGHAFGDALLSQTAAKIKESFRSEDILGRVGGDEYAALMKNVTDKRVLAAKVTTINEAIRDSYTQKGMEYALSISIGIAYFPQDGADYSTLYEHADTALYSAKQSGRDKAAFYNSSMIYEGSSIRDINLTNGLTEDKPFGKYISEYVFRMLYETADKQSAINSALELVGKHYNFSRSYIFENNADGQTARNTFEWCKAGVESQMDGLQNVPYVGSTAYLANFNEVGIFYLPALNLACPTVQELMQPQGIKSLLQFANFKGEEYVGYIGFDQCDFERSATKAEMTELKNIANVLGLFVLEMRSSQQLEATKNTVLSIINGLNSYAYVIDPLTHEMLFVNDKTCEMVQDSSLDGFCYEKFWKKTQPCTACPMHNLLASGESKATLELYNQQFNIWTRATASWVDWVDGRRVCLVDSVDISAYKM